MDFHELGDLHHAMEAFEASLEAWEEDDPSRAGIARWMIGWTMRLQGRLDEALAAQEALQREYAAAGETGLGYVEEELGEIHLAWPGDDGWKHRALARQYFVRAHELLSANGEIDHDPERLARMKRLAEGGVE
jgi:tetratricopeptide (TPR) repeat protein